MSGISIITIENKRLYPAQVYSIEDEKKLVPIDDIDNINDLFYRRQTILVISNQYDQYGRELEFFNGYLQKDDIKAVFLVSDEETSKDLDSIMTLSEAAKKWGFSDGSTIRKAIERGKFEKNEIKQAGDIWITTYTAMERVFGKIKNEEKELIIYDDFEGQLYKLLLGEAQNMYLRYGSHGRIAKENEELYEQIKEVLIKALKTIKNGHKVIMKNKRNNKTRQIFNSERELLAYVETFGRRRLMSERTNKRMVEELKDV